jgi:hypothetical protein
MTQLSANLSNWRTAPYNRWSFNHVDQLIRTAPIARGKAAPLPQGETLDISKLDLGNSSTDGFIVLHKGKIIAETYPNMTHETRHILFSVSKSVTGTLTGLLVEQGRLEPDAPLVRYLPELKPSAWREASVRHVLDMTVDLDFEENYLDTKSDFARYRVSTGWNPSNPDLGEEGLHDFLTTLRPGSERHGEKFFYASPSSDLLGWLLERVSGQPYAALLSSLIWQPMGAEADAYITIDAKGGARTAGGICTTLRDLARFAEMMRNNGSANGRQIVPASWVADIREAGSREAWSRGSMTHLFPQGSYRAKWYKANDADGSFYAIGIHGQWIYVNPRAELTAVKFSSQPDPVNDAQDLATMAMFAGLAQAVS